MHLLFKTFSGLLFLVMNVQALWALEISPKPQSKYDPVDQTDISQIFKQKNKEPKKLKSGLVRIGVKIIGFQKKAQMSQTGEKQYSFTHSEEQKYTLLGSTHEEDDFYFHTWHIHYRPQKFVPATKEFECLVTLYRMYGDYRDLEEPLQTLTLKGKLVGDQKMSVLLGMAQRRIRSKENEPLYDFMVGFSGTEEEIKNNILAKLQTKEK